MKRARLLPICLSLILLAGCTPSSAGVAPLRAPETPVAPIEAFHSEAGDLGYGAFSVELLRRCRTEGQNVLLSPLSVTLALGMTANGAGGDTLSGFESLFGTDLADLNALCAAMMKDYRALGGATEAVLVNSLWADERMELSPAFVQRCMTTYEADLFYADLQETRTVDALNDWVDEQTRGMIPSILDRFSPDAVLALVNAVYLKNKFQMPFATPHSDWTMTFTAGDGTVSQPKGMSNGVRTEQYIQTEDARGVLLPYDDGRLGLLLMLPDAGTTLTDYLAGWDGGAILSLLAARTDARVDLTMPKFKVDWGASLTDLLSDMGLGDAFSPADANFLSMGTTKNGNTVYIGDVIHKTSLAVNEKGTEAAAVTAVIMPAGGAAPQEQVVSLTLDRPFVYAIVDLAYGTPLFLGTLEQV